MAEIVTVETPGRSRRSMKSIREEIDILKTEMAAQKERLQFMHTSLEKCIKTINEKLQDLKLED